MGWKILSSVLCDTASISSTHGSNHTLQSCLLFPMDSIAPHNVQTMLQLNSGQDKNRVAATKILQPHCHLDMTPLFGMELNLLPHVVAWLERFAESRLDLKLSKLKQCPCLLLSR